MMNDTFARITASGDSDALLSLSRDEMDDFLNELMYGQLCDMPLSAMNEVQKTLYLAMTVEDTCQADGLPSLSENEEVFLALPDAAKAYERLGAPLTAGLIREFISLLPGGVPDRDRFFEGEQEADIDRIGSAIGSYPDGKMSERYVSYVKRLRGCLTV